MAEGHLSGGRFSQESAALPGDGKRVRLKSKKSRAGKKQEINLNKGEHVSTKLPQQQFQSIVTGHEQRPGW